MKIIVATDAHYGLKSAGIDRTEEIHTVMKDIVIAHAIDYGADYFIHVGDLGHTANPSSQVHRYWVDIFNLLESHKIQSRFVLGNHDAVNRKEQPFGSLAPLKRLDYQYVKAITSAELEEVSDEWGFLYLPYMSKSQMSGDVRNRYYQRRAKELVDTERNLVVFTHLNIDGAEVGGDWILRPVDAVMPRSLYQSDRVKLILSGHIHKPQTIRAKAPRHEVIGSLVCTDFGDTEEKRFASVTLKSNRCKLVWHPTNCIPLIELRYDFVGEVNPRLTIPAQVDNAGVKVRIRCTEDQLALLDFGSFATELDQRAMFVRPIVPTIIRDSGASDVSKKVARPGASDSQLVSNWINTRKPHNPKRVTELAQQVLQGENQ